MITGRRRRLAIAGLAAVCAAGAGWLVWQRRQALSTPEALAARVPARDAVVLFIDFAALRNAGVLGLLAGSPAAADAEYRDFIAKTRFDYTRDLDAAVIAFAPSGKYVLARGRFDWDRLRAYAAQSGGECRGALCRLAGSTPERNISWLPLTSAAIAMAVSRDDRAAEAMRRPDPDALRFEVPREPVWIALPPSALRSEAGLPQGTRMFARSLENADGVVFTLGQEQTRFALKMEVRCRSAEEARVLAQSMERTTSVLRDLMAREKKVPNPRDLGGVLTAGAFRSEGARVRGYWPVERVFLEELFRGANAS